MAVPPAPRITMTCSFLEKGICKLQVRAIGSNKIDRSVATLITESAIMMARRLRHVPAESLISQNSQIGLQVKTLTNKMTI